ncbi:MAG: Calx-beta domain-containing protein [Acidimicrobiia bacterium]
MGSVGGVSGNRVQRVVSRHGIAAAAGVLLLVAVSLTPEPATSLAAAGRGGGPDLEGMCWNLAVVSLPDGRALCTHGPDPAPEGVDVHEPHPLTAPGRAPGILLPDPPGDAPTTAAAAPGIACYGNGTDGNRVQALYAFPADRTDRYALALPYIRQWAAEMDAVFQSSASKTGGTRRVRFVTGSNCDLVVEKVPLSAQSDDNFNNTISELAARGYSRSDRKYLVWMDSTVLCGIATYYTDDRPTQNNFNNGNPITPGSVARIDSGCWGLGSRGQSVEGHELMHSLGAVLPTAPNASTLGHCEDDADRMCYADGSPLLVLRTICASDQEALFDCDEDDYFHSAPPPGNYLATHWNSASSSFLSATSSTPSVSISNVSVQEGNSGTASLDFPVTLSGPSSQPVSMRFATADGAARAPDDYVSSSGTLTFSPGETAKTVTVAVNGDLLDEVDEPLSVVLSSPANALLQRAEAYGTILDDDQAPGDSNPPSGPGRLGYWFVAADGGIFAFGDAGFYGSTGSVRLNQPIVGMAPTPSGNGYWFVAADGGIFAFGDAGFYGSTGNLRLNQPIVGMAPTPTGKGYWFVAADGGIFAFGDAGFYGSTGDLRPNQPIVGMAATPTGAGYWFVARDGGVYAFGDAGFFGVPTGLTQPVAALTPSSTGGGYWIADQGGGVHSFGDAPPFGSAGDLNQPVVGMARTPTGAGYWLVARDGGIFAFGDAGFYGSTGNLRLNQPIVGMGSIPSEVPG